MKNIVKGGLVGLVFFSTAVSMAFAASTPEEGGSLLLALFVGFFALIIVFQLVPACLLFIGLVKGLFSSREQESEAKRSQV
ncbi:MAG: hypothetical protein C0622_02360 [Desulfuromonas sp.]|nr:MAG: hypothetical protein C0622_02360 [Desulfuromonas sp.]